MWYKVCKSELILIQKKQCLLKKKPPTYLQSIAWFHGTFRNPVSGTGMGTGTGMQRNWTWILHSTSWYFRDKDRNRYRDANSSGMVTGMATGTAIGMTGTVQKQVQVQVQVQVQLLVWFLCFRIIWTFSAIYEVKWNNLIIKAKKNLNKPTFYYYLK